MPLKWFVELLLEAVVDSWPSLVSGALLGGLIFGLFRFPRGYMGFLAVTVLGFFSPFYGPDTFVAQSPLELQLNVIFMGIFICLWVAFVVKHIILNGPIPERVDSARGGTLQTGERDEP